MTFRVKDAVLRRSTMIGLLSMLSFSILSILISSQSLKADVPVLDEQLATYRLPPPKRLKSSSNLTAAAAPKDSFSACLLTMDDNHFLIEWLAYHYHTLPLRYLIVAVDPKSKTTPSAILEKWRNHGMVIEEWSDGDFFQITENEITTQKFPKLSKATNLHRLRQNTFYEECMKRLKDQGRTWTLLIDTDEYLAFNTHTDNLNTTLETPASFFTFIQQEVAKNDTKLKTRFQKPPCIMIPRLRYGSKESSWQQVSKDVPQHFNGSAFQTLRWRKHAPLHNVTLNRVTKAIVDVSQIPSREMVVENLHHPTNYCSGRLVTMRIRASYFVVRHYLGTWEQFSFRDDVRKVDGMRGKKVRTINWSVAFIGIFAFINSHPL